MEQVWARGEATVREVHEGLEQRPRPRAYTTVMTMMQRLADKGLLVRARQGRRDVYRPQFDREQYRALRAEAEVKALVDRHGDLVLAQFVRRVDRLTAGRLKQLRAMAGKQPGGPRRPAR
jgi:predicted transcriptional regulator